MSIEALQKAIEKDRIRPVLARETVMKLLQEPVHQQRRDILAQVYATMKRRASERHFDEILSHLHDIAPPQDSANISDSSGNVPSSDASLQISKEESMKIQTLLYASVPARVPERVSPKSSIVPLPKDRKVPEAVRLSVNGFLQNVSLPEDLSYDRLSHFCDLAFERTEPLSASQKRDILLTIATHYQISVPQEAPVTIPQEVPLPHRVSDQSFEEMIPAPVAPVYLTVGKYHDKESFEREITQIFSLLKRDELDDNVILRVCTDMLARRRILDTQMLRMLVADVRSHFEMEERDLEIPASVFDLYQPTPKPPTPLLVPIPEKRQKKIVIAIPEPADDAPESVDFMVDMDLGDDDDDNEVLAAADEFARKGVQDAEPAPVETDKRLKDDPSEPPSAPTRALPGSEGKILRMMRRHEAGIDGLHCPDDKRDYE